MFCAVNIKSRKLTFINFHYYIVWWYSQNIKSFQSKKKCNYCKCLPRTIEKWFLFSFCIWLCILNYLHISANLNVLNSYSPEKCTQALSLLLFICLNTTCMFTIRGLNRQICSLSLDSSLCLWTASLPGSIAFLKSFSLPFFFFVLLCHHSLKLTLGKSRHWNIILHLK